MARIFKYPLPTAKTVVEIPRAALFRHVGVDPEGGFCVWAEIEEHRDLVKRTFTVVGTGAKTPKGELFVGSAVMPPYVWHVFVSPEWKADQADG